MSVNQPQVHSRYWNYLTGFQIIFFYLILLPRPIIIGQLRYDRTMGFINHSQQIPSFPIPAALPTRLSSASVHCTISLRHSEIWRDTRWNKIENDESLQHWLIFNTQLDQVTSLSPSHWLHLCICSLCHASAMTTSSFLGFWLVKKDLYRSLIGRRRDIETWSITNRWGTAGTTVSILI